MEKPSGRSTSASSKAPSAETKGKQESSNKHSRTPKHKDNVYSRPEQTRRPVPQRNRIAYDKRPRSRGGYGTDKDRSEVTLTDKFGTCTAVKLGNKKLSLNHLLNFTITPPTCSLSNECRVGGWQTGRSHRKKLPKYNKEQFLQANCQFIVKEEGDYTVHISDPDILVDWDLVEEIHLPCHEVPSCPICLYPPIAAKITRCGHIYCWSCLLHYLSLSDKPWRKCPICYEAIHKNDLKSVVSTSKAAYHVGDEITMCLMKRKKGSVIARPVYQDENFLLNCPLSLNDDANCFQKLLIASKDDVKNIIQREHNELKFQLQKEAETPESCFLQSALQLLQERKKVLFQGELIEKENMLEFLTINEKLDNPESCNKPNNFQDNLINDSFQMVEYMTDPFSDEENELALCSFPDNSNDICTAAITNTNYIPVQTFKLQNSVSNVNPVEVPSYPEMLSSRINLDKALPVQKPIGNQGKEYYYFYQAIDGQNIYLNAINVQMLVREFGSLEYCPHKFTAKIVALEGESMSEALRQRLRYLRHLPLTCEFQIAELGLCSPLIKESTRDAFKGELEKRSRTRRQKAKEEKRREWYIEQEENRKLGKFPGLNYHLDSLQHFPACNQHSDIRPSPSHSLNSNHLSEQSFIADFPNSPEQSSDKLPGKSTDTEVVQPASFAQMLREGKTKRQVPQQSSTDNNIAATGFPSSDEECNSSPPLFHQSLGDAIEAALHNMNQPITDNIENSARKKKGKKMVLFTTSVNRRK